MFDVIERQTRVPLIIVDQLIGKIKSGLLKPEQRLPPERELANMLGVGRSSVREAIGVLIAMKYLEVVQGKGTFVCKELPSQHDDNNLESILVAAPMFDLMEARKMMEAISAQMAAERANAEQIALLQKAYENIEASGDDVLAFYRADHEFHEILAEATGNIFISESIKKLIHEVQTRHDDEFLKASHKTKDDTLITAQNILQAVMSGKGEEAALWMNKHLSGVIDCLREVVMGRK